MAGYLWKITVKKPIGKLAQGMWAEVVVNNSSRKPMNKEISDAFNAKYGDNVMSPGINTSYLEVVKG